MNPIESLRLYLVLTKNSSIDPIHILILTWPDNDWHIYLIN